VCRRVSLSLRAWIRDPAPANRALDVVSQSVEAHELLLARQHRVVRVGYDLVFHSPSGVGEARCALAALGSGLPEPTHPIGQNMELASLVLSCIEAMLWAWDLRTVTFSESFCERTPDRDSKR